MQLTLTDTACTMYSATFGHMTVQCTQEKTASFAQKGQIVFKGHKSHFSIFHYCTVSYSRV